MDTSMILGLALAGLIVTLSGKSPDKKNTGTKPNNTEVVVRLGDGNVVLDSKK